MMIRRYQIFLFILSLTLGLPSTCGIASASSPNGSSNLIHPNLNAAASSSAFGSKSGYKNAKKHRLKLLKAELTEAVKDLEDVRSGGVSKMLAYDFNECLSKGEISKRQPRVRRDINEIG